MVARVLDDAHARVRQQLPDALLVLGGDIDATWAGLERFAGFPIDAAEIERIFTGLGFTIERRGVGA